MERNNKYYLYQIPRRSTLIVDGEKLDFITIDGLYSHCINKNNEVIHLSVMTQYEKREDGYYLIN